jgi:pyruvate formate lyase activating enzyme
MQFSQFMTTTEDGSVRCDACQWRCVLSPDAVGKCLVRAGHQKGVVALNHGLISAASVSSIEEFRLWHFFPDSLTLAIGGWGYAFPADQQHGAFARIPSAEEKQRNLPAEKAAAFALKQLCRGVIWAYGEPAVSADYVLDLLKNSRASSRYTALVTTGFMTTEFLDSIGLYLHGISLDLRGFGDVAYSRLAGIPDWRDILTVMARAREKWQCHIEVTTRMHYGVNDKQEEVQELVQWIRDTLGEQTPWHVLPGDAGASAAHATMRAKRIGLEGGLHFVYGPESNQETRCPICQSTLMTREEGVTRMVGLNETKCTNCGFDVRLYLSIWQKK